MSAALYTQAGNSLTIPAPTGGVTKGRVYLIGALACVASQTVAQTVATTFHTTGVFTLPKDGSASVSFAVGERVFWDPVNHRVAKTNAAHFPIGCVIAAAANAATTVNVRLDGVATALVG
jgi:predicted RecA/RadA family phage recombinase